jgi:hypothetical protein
MKGLSFSAAIELWNSWMLPCDLPEVRDLLGSCVAGSQPRADPVEKLHGVEIGRERADVELRDDRGPVAQRLHEALGQ